jgi:predicted TIM-barrel fold metal-dependent hydrolase
LVDLDEYVVDVLRAAPDHIVWATDWPHSSGVAANPGGDPNKVQEYRKIDDFKWIAQCWDWCRMAEGGTGEGLAKKIWVENPKRLWQYDGVD